MDPVWLERIRVTWLGLGHLSFGACVMTIAITDADQSIWSLPQYAFGGALVTQGLLHLTLAWHIRRPPPAPPVLANGPGRVGIPLAPAEQGEAALAIDGLVLQQGVPQPLVGVVDQPVVDGIVQDAPVDDADETDPESDDDQAGPAIDVDKAGPAIDVVREVDYVCQPGPANEVAQVIDDVGVACPVIVIDQVFDDGEVGSCD